MPAKTRRPPRKCRDCGRPTHLARQALVTFIRSLSYLSDEQLDDPGDLRHLVELKGSEAAGTKRERTRDQILHLVHLDLMKDGGPANGRCGMCLFTLCAHEAAQAGKDREEVRSYNLASSFRTFYNSKLYRSAVGARTGAAA